MQITGLLQRVHDGDQQAYADATEVPSRAFQMDDEVAHRDPKDQRSRCVLALASSLEARRLDLWRQWNRKLPNNPLVLRQLAEKPAI